MFNIDQKNLKNANLFAAGLALGTVGLKVLTSKDAKKVYAGIVAAGLRAKETVLETAEKVQASASDVLAEAQEINEARNEEIFVYYCFLLPLLSFHQFFPKLFLYYLYF